LTPLFIYLLSHMKFTLLFILAFFTFQCLAQAQIITTVAGGGTGGLGDGAHATAAELNAPTGVAVDVAGNFYICERDAHRVRKVTPDGTITTIAGTGTAGYSGDGGPATIAELRFPYCITIDLSGNIYIGDQSTVRKINATGVITTVAGTGNMGYSGDGGQATLAELKGPSGLAIDGTGNLYVADKNNNRIRKVSTAGIITTIAGTGATVYNGENIPATDANLYAPSAVALDGAGNAFILEYISPRVRRIDHAGFITTIAGTGTAGYSGDGGAAISAQFDRPIGLTIDNYGNLYVGATYNDRVRKISTSGIISSIAGNGLSGSDGDGGAATAARLSTPTGLALDASGNIMVCSFSGRRIRKISGVVSIPSSPTAPTNSSMQLYPNPNTGNFTVNLSTTGQNTARIVITDITGRVVKNMPFQTNEPIPITLDAPGGIYVITAFTDDGVISQKITLLK
jgi:trimeric autotransporter adhesin